MEIGVTIKCLGNDSGCFVEGLILGMGKCGSCWSNVATRVLKMTYDSKEQFHHFTINSHNYIPIHWIK